MNVKDVDKSSNPASGINMISSNVDIRSYILLLTLNISCPMTYTAMALFLQSSPWAKIYVDVGRPQKIPEV